MLSCVFVSRDDDPVVVVVAAVVVSTATGRRPSQAAAALDLLRGLLGVALLALSLGCGSDPRGPVPSALAAEGKSQRLPDWPTSTRSTSEELGQATVNPVTPAIRRASYVSVVEADEFLRDDDLVFVVQGNSATLVFPRIILSPHHVVNETIDGQAVLVTYCQLSECASLFSRVVDGTTLTFEWLQALYRGTLVLGDIDTESRWIQLSGECYHGPRRGKRLTLLGDLERRPWSAVRSLAGARVLRPIVDLSSSRQFVEAMDSEQVGLRALKTVTTEVDERLPPYERGLGLLVRGQSYFFRLRDLAAVRLLERTVGGWAILAVRDGDAVRLFRRFVRDRRLTFERENDTLRDLETRSIWTLEGRCVSGKLAGEQLEEPLSTQVWWYAWSALYPKTRLSGTSTS